LSKRDAIRPEPISEHTREHFFEFPMFRLDSWIWVGVGGFAGVQEGPNLVDPGPPDQRTINLKSEIPGATVNEPPQGAGDLDDASGPEPSKKAHIDFLNNVILLIIRTARKRVAHGVFGDAADFPRCLLLSEERSNSYRR